MKTLPTIAPIFTISCVKRSVIVTGENSTGQNDGLLLPRLCRGYRGIFPLPLWTRRPWIEEQPGRKLRLQLSKTQKRTSIKHCYGLHWTTSFVTIRPHSSAHSGDSGTQRPTLPSWPSIGRSLGRVWRSRPGRPRARWTDQLCNDTGSVIANLLRQAILRGHGGATRRPELTTR